MTAKGPARAPKDRPYSWRPTGGGRATLYVEGHPPVEDLPVGMTSEEMLERAEELAGQANALAAGAPHKRALEEARARIKARTEKP